MDQFDVVLAGSSPIILLEALHQNSMGKRVLILETLRTIGGAWASRDILGYRNIEVGCHYLHFNKRTYDFLRNRLHLKLASRRRRVLGNPVKKLEDYIPTRILRWVFNSYYSSRCRPEPIDHFQSALLNLTFARVNRTKKSLINAKDGFFMKYPTQGCGEMVEAILKIIRKTNIEIRIDHQIDSVDCGDSEVTITGTRFKVSCAKFIGGEGGKYDFLKGGELLDVDYDQGVNQHIVMKVKGAKLKSFSYLNIHQNSYFKRVTDVGEHRTPKGEYLFCCQIHKEHYNQVKSSLALQELKNLKIFSPASQLIDWSVHNYDIFYKKRDQKHKINKTFKGCIQILDTYDLSKSIGENLIRWEM